MISIKILKSIIYTIYQEKYFITIFLGTDKNISYFLSVPAIVNIQDSEEEYQGYSPFPLQHLELGILV